MKNVMKVVSLVFCVCVPLYGTFSIVAVDPETEEFGVAVASRVPDVGFVVPFIKTNVGAVASQAYSNPYIGPWVIEFLESGKDAHEALKLALEKDSLSERRQVGVVDYKGNAVAHTGTATSEWAGHRIADYVSVQGNILTGPEVIDSMFAVFGRTKGPLGERLLAALEAGEAAGGDKRGKQSAALYVMRERGWYQGAGDRLIEVKVIDHPEPVKELRRQFDVVKYAFLAPAYLRLSGEAEGEKREFFLERTYALLLDALESDIQSAEVYNSLAWEFATRKMYPEETLKAAKKAHALAPEDANIMDTLAEAYYAIGLYERAVFYEEEALKREPDNEFFIEQLKKFQKALESD
jgi:uncharacterized Ntn-hydrolase superfamily protein